MREFQKLKVEKNFNIFHSNVNGLESKFGNLHTFLAGATSQMDVVAITETSEHIDHGFLSNIDMEGYKLFNTATKSSKGGAVLYVNNDFDSFERVDLKMQNDLLEAVWIEIKNSKSKNIVCGCIYRHPKRLNKDLDDFNKYMDSTLDKLVKEKKEVYICGDFNIDLLKLNEIDTHMDFYTLLSSHGLLPFITQPSRVVESQTPSLIDNIFSTNISDAVLLLISYLKYVRSCWKIRICLWMMFFFKPGPYTQLTQMQRNTPVVHIYHVQQGLYWSPSSQTTRLLNLRIW